MTTPYTTDAICLKATDYSESSKIIHAYSPRYGLVRAMVKGARAKNSKLAGVCQLLSYSQIQCLRGKSLDSLTQYQNRETFLGIRSHLLKLAGASLMAELVNRACGGSGGDGGHHGLEGQGHGEADSEVVFALVLDGLRRLENLPPDEPSALAAQVASFQMGLLRAVGYEPVLDRCVLTGQVLDDSRTYYPFSAEWGGVFSGAHHPDPSGSTVAEGDVMRELGRIVNVSTPTLQALRDPLNETIWQAASVEKVFRFLQYYWQDKLEARVRGFDFWLEMLLPEPIVVTGAVKTA